MKTALLKMALKILSKIIVPDKNTVLFGAMNGKYYGDNSRHLFEWILKNRKYLNPVWLTKDMYVYRELKKEKKPVVLINSLKGFKLLLKAKVGLFTNSLRDLALNVFIIPNTLNLIALRHGRSVKKIRFARERHKISERETKEREKENKHIKYAISTSEFISDVQEQCLLIGRDKHIVTGYPRNDELFSYSTESLRLWKKYLGNNNPRKVILYGPSWRHGREATKFFPFNDFDSEELINFLKSQNILLLLRPHKNDLSKYENLYKFLAELADSSELIKFASHKVFPDVNMILSFIDILISDYSALYHDFLLLDRPLIFVPYDYEDFRKQNGFLYDYYKNLPGPAVDSFQEFCFYIEQFCQGQDSFAEKRKVLRDKIHFYKDAASCERVTKLIDNILQEKI